MLSDQENIRMIQILKTEMARRLEKNPQYSIRAFARDLELDQSLLTRVFTGERRISERVKKIIDSKLESAHEEPGSMGELS